MTSQLNVDTIVDKAGSGGSNVKMDNTSTYVAEGGVATQNTVQGLCKCWNFATQPSATIQDSFNVASMQDDGTGLMTHNYTNNMANGEYSAQLSLTNNINQWWCPDGNTTTTKVQSRTYTGSSYSDQDHMIAIMGDLA
jgi:hypothetical protein